MPAFTATQHDSARDTLRLEALGLMTAGIVHDLGNMIQVLSSALNILGRHPQVLTAATLKPVVAGAIDSIDRASDLVGQILGFVRQDALVERDVDVALAIVGMEPLLRWMCPAPISLCLEVDASIPKLRCNPHMLENAMLNLVMNARDASPAGGTITVFARRGRSIGGFMLELGVSDSGSGMSAATTEQAFEPLFTTKSLGQGSGLGLPMVQRFARQAGGNARIDSALGRGTTVTMQFPMVGEHGASDGVSQSSARDVELSSQEDDMWLDAALADSFPASDPLPTRRDTATPSQTRATGPSD